ncbi:lysoplasmalogenase [Leptobacterium sp. I13]|uniref:lysoplasmalogenase n=1 Tax=Leptobacterium meishanense TaxID=3128904 RepID=UPI0030EEE3CA
MNKTSFFLIIYVVLVVLELLSNYIFSSPWAHYITKPAIVTSLLVYFLCSSIRLPRVKLFASLALISSIGGDVVLMFVEESNHFFIAGLILFLIAHLMYIITFSLQRNKKIALRSISFLLLSYGFGVFWILKDTLGALLLPVSFYMIVILTMVLMAYARKGTVTRESFALVFIGALFFILSDTLLAFNKFYSSIPYAKILIMGTYAIAQYYIVHGILKNNHPLSMQ